MTKRANKRLFVSLFWSLNLIVVVVVVASTSRTVQPRNPLNGTLWPYRTQKCYLLVDYTWACGSSSSGWLRQFTLVWFLQPPRTPKFLILFGIALTCLAFSLNYINSSGEEFRAIQSNKHTFARYFD